MAKVYYVVSAPHHVKIETINSKYSKNNGQKN